MLKNKLWPLLVLAACAPKEPKLLVADHWLEARKSFTSSRLPAAGGGNVSCRSDLFSVEEVKREALHYESQLNTGPKISGRWRHLDLRTLPVPQAKFLKAMGEEIGDLNNPNAVDYSQCRDAVCVVNAVYRSTDGLEGWASYLWYLKMGYFLSLKNKVYEQKSSAAGFYNGKTYPLSDYLFTRDELYAFWRMSHALTTPFKTLPIMKEIQRIPKKSEIEGMGAGVCGLAWSSGYILVNDGCLSFWGDQDKGFIYEGVTHEIAHQIDYKLGRENGGSYYSQIGRWKADGQWSLKEFYDEANRRTVNEWSTTLTNEQFVRSYARTSPAEHFADTAAYYRYSGETTKKKVPAVIYRHLKEVAFDQLEYDTPGLFDQFQTDVGTLLAPELFRTALECDQKPVASNSTKPLAETLFPFSVDIKSRRCLREGLDRILDQAVVEAKLNHVDGCAQLRTSAQILAFKSKLEPAFSRQVVQHIKVARENQLYYQRLTEFYDSLSKQTEPLKIVTGCYGQVDEKQCYDEQILAYVERIVPRDLVNAENLRRDLQKMYLDANGFDATRALSQKLHQDFLFSQSALLDASAKELWRTCASRPIDNREAPVPGPFSVGEGWMVSSQFNCLSLEIPSEVKRAISAMSFEAMGVSDGSESRLLFDLALPLYVKEIQRFFDLEKADEVRELQSFVRAHRASAIGRLTATFDWVEGLGQAMSRSCQREVAKDLPRSYRFHDPERIFVSHTDEICGEVLKSSAFQEWLKTQRELVEVDVVKTYISVYEQVARDRAQACLARFPNSNIVLRLMNKKKREACYLERWNQVEDQAWREASAKYQSTFQFNRQSLLRQVEDQARVLKLEIQESVLGSTSTSTGPAPVEDRSSGTPRRPSTGERVDDTLEAARRGVGSFLSRMGELIQDGAETVREALDP